MAAGDAVTSWASKANNAVTDLLPGSGVEWLIHTIVSGSGKSIEIYLSEDNGSTWTLVETYLGGSVHGLTYRLINATCGLRIKNVSGGSAYLGYMGVQSK